MGKDNSAVCRLCRREGEKLFLKGTRCYTPKCALERRDYAPGQHGAKRSKLSNFGLQLREKQKVKRIYGLMEKQFRGYFEKAAQTKGITGATLLQYLERRLDSVIFQTGFAASRREARQIVGHGFICVNDKRVNIPSFLVKQDDEIAIKFTNNRGLQNIKDNIEMCKNRVKPAWLKLDEDHYCAKVLTFLERKDIQYNVNEQLFVELYSR